MTTISAALRMCLLTGAGCGVTRTPLIIRTKFVPPSLLCLKSESVQNSLSSTNVLMASSVVTPTPWKRFNIILDATRAKHALRSHVGAFRATFVRTTIPLTLIALSSDPTVGREGVNRPDSHNTRPLLALLKLLHRNLHRFCTRVQPPFPSLRTICPCQDYRVCTVDIAQLFEQQSESLAIHTAFTVALAMTRASTNLRPRGRTRRESDYPPRPCRSPNHAGRALEQLAYTYSCSPNLPREYMNIFSMGLRGVLALQSFHFLHSLFTDAAISQSMLGMENCYDYGSFPDSPFCSRIVLVFSHRPISLLFLECYPHCRIDHTQYYFICRGAFSSLL
jgi:hypothetical protein